MRTALALAAIAFALALALAGCMPPNDPDPPAQAEDMAGAAPGSGKFSVDGGQPVTIPDGGKQPLYAACATNDQCQSGICNAYPAKGGSFCVNACTPTTQATDCPPPSPGCNHMGFCKVQ
ncbi:MAG TPA: hypothetical protein VFF06_36140 [Polyangia bacterium]|nr:hypothetical protein [Polyangia bacterium]